jgi:hypothetical protein
MLARTYFEAGAARTYLVREILGAAGGSGGAGSAGQRLPGSVERR